MTIRKARIPQAGAYNNKRLSFAVGRMENGEMLRVRKLESFFSSDGRVMLRLYVTCWVDKT